MEKIVTVEMIQQSSDYATNAFKEKWCSETAPKCFDRLSITADSEPMPPMYMVNMGLKKRYLMTMLVGAYLKQPWEPDEKDPALMSEADFDAWDGSHVFGQIERLKKNKDISDKIFDLLFDYHEIEKRLSAQIAGLLNVQNDSVLRQSQLMANQIKELPQLVEQLKQMQEKAGGEHGE